jgi:trans-aconitate methyltransferase
MCVCGSLFIHSFIHCHIPGLLLSLAVMNNAAVHMDVHISVHVSAFNLSACIPTSGIAVLYANSVISFLRNHCTGFYLLSI